VHSLDKMSTSESSNYTPDIPLEPITKTTDTMHIELTPHDLDSLAATRFVRSPSAGATVLFIGTTRDSFNDKAVSSLSYTSYAPLAIATLYKIASSTYQTPLSILISYPGTTPSHFRYQILSTLLTHSPQASSKNTLSPGSPSFTNLVTARSAKRAS
jgi:hypothetical protein